MTSCCISCSSLISARYIACINYEVERQRHNRQVNYTQESFFFPRRAFFLMCTPSLFTYNYLIQHPIVFLLYCSTAFHRFRLLPACNFISTLVVHYTPKQAKKPKRFVFVPCALITILTKLDSYYYRTLAVFSYINFEKPCEEKSC